MQLDQPNAIKYKYERLNLNVDVYNQIPSGTSILREPRTINKATYDAAFIFLDWIQVHGLIWTLALAYPWPEGWLDATSWTGLFNLDWYTFAKYHGGDYLSPLIHNILVLVSPWIAVIGLFFVRRFIVSKESQRKIKSVTEVSTRAVGHELVAVWILEFLYLPVALSFFRSVACTDSASDVRLTPLSALTQCESSDHYMMIIIAVIFGATYLLGLPFYFYKRAGDVIVYHDAFNHERSLANREMEYLLGLNDVYVRNRFNLVSSYTRTSAFYRSQYCIMRTLLALFVVILGPAISTSTAARRLNAGIVLILICIPLCARLFGAKTYRLTRSNRLQMISDVTLAITGVLALLTAGNPLSDLVASERISPVLIVVNAFGILAILFWPLITYLSNTTPQWVVSEDDVFDICVGNSELLTALNDSKILFDDALFTPSEFFPRYKVKELVGLFKRYHADFQGKIDRVRRTPHAQLPLVRFTRKELELDPERARQLNSRRRDLGVMLEWSVEDMLEDLSHLYSIMRHTFSAFDDPMGTEGPRFQLMSKCLRGFGHAIRKKNFDRLLMRPEKHALLRKLLFMRQFLGAEFVATKSEARKFQPVSFGPRPSGVSNLQLDVHAAPVSVDGDLQAQIHSVSGTQASEHMWDDANVQYEDQAMVDAPEYYPSRGSAVYSHHSSQSQAPAFHAAPQRASQTQPRASGTVLVSSYTRPSIQGNPYQPYDTTAVAPSSTSEYPMTSGGSGEMQVHVVPSAPRGSTISTTVGENPFYVGTVGARSSLTGPNATSAIRTSIVNAFTPRESYTRLQQSQSQQAQGVNPSSQLFDSDEDEDAEHEDQSLL